MANKFAKYGKEVTFRVKPDEDKVRVEFFENIEKMHTDQCYVFTALMKAWNLGLKDLPSPDAFVQMKFPQQQIQLNIGCNFHYHTKKARRTLPTSRLPEMEMRKNMFFPLLLEEWGTLKEHQKQFWRNELIKAGIMPPPEPEHKPKRKLRHEPKPKPKRKLRHEPKPKPKRKLRHEPKPKPKHKRMSDSSFTFDLFPP